MAMLAAPAASSAFVSVSVTIAPPAIPVYVQPLCPGPGYMWVPGYWAWDPYYGYYWVPGVWVLAPFPGALWTPGYWGWSDGVYVWYGGYWGPVVGFYGGINYGFGYTGYGYYGGYWRGNVFYYNRAVTNVNVTNIRNVYYNRVTRFVTRRTSYNGGPGGIRLHPTAAQMAAARSPRRLAPLANQRRQEQMAQSDPRQRATVNRGRPGIAATRRPGVFTGAGVVRAKRAGAPYRAAPRYQTPRQQRQPQMERPFAAPPHERSAYPPTEYPRTQQPPEYQRMQQPPMERQPGASRVMPMPSGRSAPPRSEGRGGRGHEGRGGPGRAGGPR